MKRSFPFFFCANICQKKAISGLIRLIFETNDETPSSGIGSPNLGSRFVVCETNLRSTIDSASPDMFRCLHTQQTGDGEHFSLIFSDFSRRNPHCQLVGASWPVYVVGGPSQELVLS